MSGAVQSEGRLLAHLGDAGRHWRSAALSLLVHGGGLLVALGMTCSSGVPDASAVMAVELVPAPPEQSLPSAPPQEAAAPPSRPAAPDRPTPVAPTRRPVKSVSHPRPTLAAPHQPAVTNLAAFLAATPEAVAEDTTVPLAPPKSDGADPAVETTATAAGPAGEMAAGQARIDPYLAAVRRRIQQVLVYPAAASRLRLTGQVRLRFSILADGRVALDTLRIVGGTEEDLLQEGALDTIRGIGAFPPPPAGAVAIELPVAFALNR